GARSRAEQSRAAYLPQHFLHSSPLPLSWQHESHLSAALQHSRHSLPGLCFFSFSAATVKPERVARVRATRMSLRVFMPLLLASPPQCQLVRAFVWLSQTLV